MQHILVVETERAQHALARPGLGSHWAGHPDGQPVDSPARRVWDHRTGADAMKSRTISHYILLCCLACLPGLAHATVFLAPVKAFGPEDEVRLDSAERAALEVTACFGWAAERREYVITYRASDQSLLAFVRCHGFRDSEGQIPVNEIRCKQEIAKAAWQCEQHNSHYRIDRGEQYVLAADPLMTIEVPGEPPDRSANAVAAILATEPQRLNGKYCELPQYRDGAFEIECDGVHYVVKRSCDAKVCRRAVRRMQPTTEGLGARD